MTDRKTDEVKPPHHEQHGTRRCRFWFYTTVGIVLIHCLLAGCAVKEKTPTLELTPVTDSPTGIHLQGKFVWNDLLTDDLAAAKVFYGQLFGWTFEQLAGYTVIKNNHHSIGGMVEIRDLENTKIPFMMF